MWVWSEGPPPPVMTQMIGKVGKLGEAAAVSLIMLAILVAFTTLYVWLVRRRQTA